MLMLLIIKSSRCARNDKNETWIPGQVRNDNPFHVIPEKAGIQGLKRGTELSVGEKQKKKKNHFPPGEERWFRRDSGTLAHFQKRNRSIFSKEKGLVTQEDRGN